MVSKNLSVSPSASLSVTNFDLNYQNPIMGVLAIFSTGTYAIIGTMCVESETCYEENHEKKTV